MMNITGSSISSWWHNRLPPEDEAEKVKEKKDVLEV
jgi:hypothetical protein